METRKEFQEFKDEAMKMESSQIEEINDLKMSINSLNQKLAKSEKDRKHHAKELELKNSLLTKENTQLKQVYKSTKTQLEKQMKLYQDI